MGQKCLFFFRQATRPLRYLYGYLWKFYFWLLTKFIEILTVTRMSLHWLPEIWAQSFFTSSPWPSLQFFGAFETVGKLLLMQSWQHWPTQIRRWKYQSTVKYLSGFAFLSTSPQPSLNAQVLPLLNCVTSLVDNARALADWIHLKSPMLPEGYRKNYGKMRSLQLGYHFIIFFRCLFIIFRCLENRPSIEFQWPGLRLTSQISSFRKAL